ncbi:methyltransferase domain-containing protein [Streptomyces sp. NPDC048644]|uniref:methyltransferase domain-containing protein n=1 Tax=Streptomyces sp. NPDC048644 TaxID=3365582 RepID=UPI003719EA79
MSPHPIRPIGLRRGSDGADGGRAVFRSADTATAAKGSGDDRTTCRRSRRDLHRLPAVGAVGCDLPPAMLDHARAKPHADQVRFEEADLRHLPDWGEFDVICAVTNPMDHLLTDEDFASALHGIVRSLAPDGVFLFDQLSERAHHRSVRHPAVRESDGQFLTCRTWQHTLPTEPEPVFTRRMDRFVRHSPGQWHRIAHQNTFRARSETSVRRLLTRAHLDCVAVHPVSRLRQGGQRDRSDEGVLFVARHQPRQGRHS